MGARYPYYLLADSPRRPAQGSRSHPHRARARSRCTATSATASSMSACRTSRSSPSPTTPRSTSSGRSGRQTLEPLREKLNAALKKTWQEWEIPREADAKWPDDGEEAARRLVAGAHRPAEGDRRLHRRQGRVRIPLRQALRGQEEGPRRRAVHRREPLARTACSAWTRTTS